jgi:hypothetical protein
MDMWKSVVLFLAVSSVVCEATASATSNDSQKPAQANAIECIMPDGQSAENILTLENGTLRCPLRQGDTIFVIPVARNTALGRFTFINENTAAQGEFRIAVSNEKLSADSDRWTPVEGAVSFKHKRLFNLSMLGVDAKYVRLTFHVEHENDMTALGQNGTTKR